MAADSKAGHNGVNDEVLGSLKIDLNANLGLKLSLSGVMSDPAFLEMVCGYLRQYTNRQWDKNWKKED